MNDTLRNFNWLSGPKKIGYKTCGFSVYLQKIVVALFLNLTTSIYSQFSHQGSNFRLLNHDNFFVSTHFTSKQGKNKKINETYNQGISKP